MAERRYSRYTRERTWLALVSQAENTQYCIVPYSQTTNSVSLVRIREAEENRSQVQKLLDEYGHEMGEWENGKIPDKPALHRKCLEAVVLARSSDYYRYHLAEYGPQKIDLVVCGLHDAYCLLPVLEMRTNRRYAARETSIDIQSPEFAKVRKTEYGHTILLTALVKGDQKALAFLDQRGSDGKFLISVSTRNRIKREVVDLQTKVYRGRPLAFMTKEEAEKHAANIKEGMKKHHAKKGRQ
jgi:hypothetical protein